MWKLDKKILGVQFLKHSVVMMVCLCVGIIRHVCI